MQCCIGCHSCNGREHWHAPWQAKVFGQLTFIPYAWLNAEPDNAGVSPLSLISVAHQNRHASTLNHADLTSLNCAARHKAG